MTEDSGYWEWVGYLNSFFKKFVINIMDNLPATLEGALGYPQR